MKSVNPRPFVCQRLTSICDVHISFQKDSIGQACRFTIHVPGNLRTILPPQPPLHKENINIIGNIKLVLVVRFRVWLCCKTLESLYSSKSHGKNTVPVTSSTMILARTLTFSVSLFASFHINQQSQPIFTTYRCTPTPPYPHH